MVTAGPLSFASVTFVTVLCASSSPEDPIPRIAKAGKDVAMVV